MLLNSFCQMAQFIVYAFINEAKQRAVWPKKNAIYGCISLYIYNKK